MTPFWTFGDLIFLLLLYIPISVASMVVMGRRPTGMLAGQLIGYAAWFCVIALLLRIKYGRPFWKSLGWKNPRTLWFAIPGGVAVMLLIAYASQVLRLPSVDSPVRALLEDPRTLPLAAVAIVIVGPLAEELFFRGLAQPLLVQSSGAVAGIVLTAIAFGLLHAPQIHHAWGQVALIAAAGTIFGAVRHLTGSTLASTAMHASYNGSLLAAYLWEKTHG